MAHLVMHGRFQVKGRSPDGDSIAFAANTKELWNQFKWDDPKKNPANKKKAGATQLRIEAVDALETHFEGFHQPKAIAEAATDTLLKSFGITGISYNLNFTKIVDADDDVEGTIITKGLDGFDRPISFAFLGHVRDDGEHLESLDADLVRKSVNHHLAERGVTYPAYYNGIDPTALEVFQKTFARVRAGRVGIWGFDQTQEFIYWGPQSMSDTHVVYPKVFRRFVSFAEACDDWADVQGYIAKQDDKLTILSSGKFMNLSDAVAFDGRKVSVSLDFNDVRWGPKQEPSAIA
jgi:hypothetical protein